MPIKEDVERASYLTMSMIKSGMAYGLAVHRSAMQFGVKQEDIIDELNKREHLFKKAKVNVYKDNDEDV